MVVYAIEPGWLDSDETDYDRPIWTLETHSWFLGHIQPQLDRRDAAAGLVLPGGGKPIRVIEPGHAFADYLAQRNAYVARLSDVIRLYANALVLAENRSEQPVAAAFEIGRGSLVMVPPPIVPEDHAALDAGLEEALEQRLSAREWTLAAERDLIGAHDKALADLRAMRLETSEKLADIRAFKARALGDLHVRRALGYWYGATRPGTAAARAFQELYRMQEMIEDLLGGGEKTLATTLGVPLARLKSLKKMANRPEYDFRHATIGDPERPPSEEIQAAVEDARALVQGFVEHRYRVLRSAAASGDGGDDTNSA